MNGGSFTANQVKDEAKMLKQKFFQTESAIQNIFFKRLSVRHDSEYLGLPGIKQTYLVHLTNHSRLFLCLF
jgi:hypothetical protein